MDVMSKEENTMEKLEIKDEVKEVIEEVAVEPATPSVGGKLVKAGLAVLAVFGIYQGAKWTVNKVKTHRKAKKAAEEAEETEEE